MLEDSIERGELRQTIMEMMAEAISRDMEEVLINGDTLSADPFLAVMDGVLKQTTSNIVDAAATIATDKRCVLYVWYDNEFGYSCQVMRLVQHLAGVNPPVVP